jgi:hypothetical protein
LVARHEHSVPLEAASPRIERRPLLHEFLGPLLDVWLQLRDDGDPLHGHSLPLLLTPSTLGMQ